MVVINGLKILRMVPVLGHHDEPHGHGELLFDDVRLPASHIIAGPGRGFGESATGIECTGAPRWPRAMRRPASGELK